MQSYRRDFTIGEKETQRFYRMLALQKWRRGIVGFGLAGALAAWMYLGRTALPLAVKVPVILAGFLAGMLLSALCVIVSTFFQVRAQIRQSGRGIRVTVDQDKARLDFDRLQEVRETGGAFYLFLAPGQAWILPKAQMEDPAAECGALREIFRTVVPSGRLRLKK